ncbi:MAG: YtxH domain-containing protein [Nitrospira sp.]
MHNRNHGKEGNVDAMGWSAFMAGALIGAGVALLFAPQAGTEMRGTLRKYANRAKDDLMEKGQEAWDAAVERGKEYYDQGEQVVRHVRRSTEEVIQRGEEVVKDAGRSAKEYANQTQEAVREAGR